MSAIRTAVIGAVLLGALSTLYDFIWAWFSVRHTVVHGLVHGVTLLAAAGLVLALEPRRPVAGLVGGAVVGAVAAGSFYAFFPLLGYLWAMVAAWMFLWLLFAVLEARLRGASPFRPAVLVRGLAAAVLSGLAFWMIADIWTEHPPGGPNYLWNFARWTFAFFPGFAALLAPVPPRGPAGEVRQGPFP